MSRVLVTGASGLLGSAVALRLAGRHEVFALSHSRPTAFRGVEGVACDLRNPRAVRESVARIRPEIVVHAAALTGVDSCERDPGDAVAVNVWGTRNLLDACRDVAEMFCYISTDFVFDGSRGPYREADIPFPVNVYGCTKLAGEWFVQASGLPWAIVRATFFGVRPGPSPSFVEQALRELRAGRPVRAWANRFSTPLFSGDLADVVVGLVEGRGLGMWHAGCRKRVSGYDLLRCLAVTFDLDPDLVRPEAWRGEPGAAARPLDTSLDSSRLVRWLGRAPGDISTALLHFKAFLEAGGS